MNDTRGHLRFHHGFTLFELLITVAVLAIIVAVILPRATDDDRLRIRVASNLIMADIELAQAMTISSPKDPVVVRFDAPNNRYWLAYATDPLTPITRAGTNEPYIVTMGAGRAVGAQGVSFTLGGMPQSTLAFNAHGGLSDFNAEPDIILEAANGNKANRVRVSIAATTGRLYESDVISSEVGLTEGSSGR